MKQTIDLLKTTGVFSRLTVEELTVLAENSELRTYGNGEPVFSEGELAEELYIVSEGEVSVSRTNDDGKKLKLARLIRNDVFGELEFFQHAIRNASAEASAEVGTVLLRFPKQDYNFKNLLKDYPRISAKLLHSFIAVIAGRIRSTNKLVSQNSPLVQELRRQVYGDTLTGLYNKAYLDEQLYSFLGSPSRPVALVMVKPDNFKWINDNCGHDAGDETIRALARAYAEHAGGVLGKETVMVRYMGNEFGFVLPGYDRDRARQAAEALQRLVHNLELGEITGDTGFRLTASFGIAVYPLHAKEAPVLIEKAHELPLIGRHRGGGKILFPEDKGDA